MQRIHIINIHRVVVRLDLFIFGSHEGVGRGIAVKWFDDISNGKLGGPAVYLINSEGFGQIR